MSTVIYGKDVITNSTDPVNISENKLHIAQYIWDTNTLNWIKQTGTSGGAGTDVSVTNFPSTQQISGNVGSVTYSKRYEQVDSTLAYLGDAAIGASENSSVWRIQKLDFTAEGNVTITFADGNDNFDNNWSNRASLSYS